MQDDRHGPRADRGTASVGGSTPAWRRAGHTTALFARIGTDGADPWRLDAKVVSILQSEISGPMGPKKVRTAPNSHPCAQTLPRISRSSQAHAYAQRRFAVRGEVSRTSAA